MSVHEYVDDRNYITYGDAENKLVFIRRCPHCSKFVKANHGVRSNGEGLANEPNGMCSKHGEIQMPFLGYF